MRFINIVIILMAITYATDIWGLQIKPVKESPDVDMYRLDKMNMVRGVMTRITDKSIVIDGREYSASTDLVVKYQGGGRIEDLTVLRNIDSAIVRAFIEHGMVKEVIIEGFELRH